MLIGYPDPFGHTPISVAPTMPHETLLEPVSKGECQVLLDSRCQSGLGVQKQLGEPMSPDRRYSGNPLKNLCGLGRFLQGCTRSQRRQYDRNNIIDRFGCKPTSFYFNAHFKTSMCMLLVIYNCCLCQFTSKGLLLYFQIKFKNLSNNLNNNLAFSENLAQWQTQTHTQSNLNLS